MNNELSIESLRTLCMERSIFWTVHILERLQERDIYPSDIKHCIMNGEIIEHYPNSYPYPSCLILGIDLGDHYLHCVIGSNGVKLWGITAYHPTLDKWEIGYKTRKAVK